MQSWQMQEAKARLSELVKRAESDGPQDITMHGRSVAVVLSRSAFDALASNKQSLVEFMRSSPLYAQEEISFERDKGPTRKVAL